MSIYTLLCFVALLGAVISLLFIIIKAVQKKSIKNAAIALGVCVVFFFLVVAVEGNIIDSFFRLGGKIGVAISLALIIIKAIQKKPVKNAAIALAVCLAAVIIATPSGSVSSIGKSNTKVQDALQGSWIAKWGNGLSRYYIIEGNKYTTGGVAVLGELEPETGTFQIRSSKIHFIPDDGSDPNDLKYKYNDKLGIVSLWWVDDIQFEKTDSPIQSTEATQVKISKSEAEENAKYRLSHSGKSTLAQKAGCASVGNVKIGTIDCSYNEGWSNYTVTIKGTFWEVDEYGKTGHLYDYTMVYTVDGDKGWVFDSSCNVSRSYGK